MDLRGEEVRRLLGEESFKLLGQWLDSCEREAESPMSFAIKDEKGEVLITFESTSKMAFTIVYLLDRVGKALREKLADWMSERGFAMGMGETIDDLLGELSWQIAELRLRAAISREEIREALKTVPREDLAKAGIV